MAGRGCNERTEERTGRRHSACDATNDEIIRHCQLAKEARPRKRVEEGEETSRGLFLARRAEEIANSKYNQRNYNSEGRGREGEKEATRKEVGGVSDSHISISR